MRIRLSEELYATGLVQFLQLLQNLRSVKLQLLHTDTREREGNLEILTALLYHLLDSIECRHIRALCDVVDATLILIIIIVIMISTDIEEAVAFQMGNLMYLEI